MNEIIILEFDYENKGSINRIHPVVIRDKDHVILVDCGVKGTLSILEDVLHKNKVNPEDITHLMITHHDQDHMGNLFAFKEKYPDVIIVTSEKEADYVSGKKEFERLTHAQSILDTMSKEEQGDWEAFIELLKTIKPVAVDVTVKAGDIFDICGGIEILDTKGHTSGHVSLLLSKMDTVIAGDAAFLNGRKLEMAPDRFTIDKDNAQVSLEIIKDLDVKNVICYHGGLLSR